MEYNCDNNNNNTYFSINIQPLQQQNTQMYNGFIYNYYHQYISNGYFAGYYSYLNNMKSISDLTTEINNKNKLLQKMKMIL